MNIIWRGQFCFEIIAAPAKNSQIKIIIDPFSEEIGLKPPKLEADIILVTYDNYDHNNIKAVSANSSTKTLTESGRKSLGQNPFLIEGPGEYEIKNVFIQGINSPVVDNSSRLPLRSAPRRSISDDKKGKERGENTIYTIETEDLKLCHLGDLRQQELTEEQLEKIGEIDILMIPIGGVYTVSAREALKIMAQIEPKITIPMHYALPKLNPPVGGKLDGLDKFLKSLGIKSIASENKLTVKKKDLSEEEARIAILNP